MNEFELKHVDEIDKITEKINKFSCDWDSGEITDGEWEALRLKKSRELAIEILKCILGE